MSKGDRVEFNHKWMQIQKYSGWAQPHVSNPPKDSDKYMAYCKPCRKSFQLGNMGISALDSHNCGQKHKENLQTFKDLPVKIDNYFQSNDQTQQQKDTTKQQKEKSLLHDSAQFQDNSMQSISSFLLKDEITKAEIIWTLSVVYHHISMSTGGKLVNSIKLILKNFHCPQADLLKLGNDKLSYSIVYGLGPFFRNKTIQQVLDCDIYALSADESFHVFFKKSRWIFLYEFGIKSDNKQKQNI